MPQKGTTPPLPEIRTLKDSELEILRQTAKVIVDDIVWHDVSRQGHTARRWEARVDVYPANPKSLPFSVQSNMELVLATNRGGEQDFYYRLVMTKQIVRMYHNAPGHLEAGGYCPGQHKHTFTANKKRGGYIPDPPLEAAIREAVLGFLKEESIELRGRHVLFAIPTRVDYFKGEEIS